MPVLDVILLVALAAVCLGGVLMTVLQLPGTWLILGCAALYAWHGDWRRVSLATVGIVAAIALAAEGAEALSAVWLSRRGGASRRAAWYGLIGGIAGALLLSVPVPVIGTLIGAAVGCFFGALIGELQSGKDPVSGARAGVYAAIGRTVGATLKLAAALVMTAIIMVSALTAG